VIKYVDIILFINIKIEYKIFLQYNSHVFKTALLTQFLFF